MLTPFIGNGGIASGGASGDVTLTRADVDNLRLDGNTISSTDANGNINLTPNGTGNVVVDTGSNITVANNYGFYQTGRVSGFHLLDDVVTIYHNNFPRQRFNNSATLDFGDGGGTFDTGISRSSAGVFKVTDGSTGIRGFFGGGAAIASATALPVPTGRVCHVTGTTTITSITSTNLQSGVVVTLIFDDTLTVTDGSNLKLAGNFVTTADDTLTLVYDGTNWYETGRSVN